ncbi:MAG TPA: nitroreductase/quinone reductase family protein [Nitrolancea sp.]|jgi:deazaflavin-dependent oxidoreductase (nitroreductase family)|nr:nitroreductase/quinone reductase family protein [Nitrolancea sp.]
MAAFDPAVLETVATEREVELTTWGRKSGNPSRVILWVFGDGERVFIRSGGGLGRDWPRNLLANGKAVLHVAGHDVAVRGVHVEDPTLARHVSSVAGEKYKSGAQRSSENEELTPGESATFELFLDDANA